MFLAVSLTAGDFLVADSVPGRVLFVEDVRQVVSSIPVPRIVLHPADGLVLESFQWNPRILSQHQAEAQSDQSPFSAEPVHD